MVSHFQEDPSKFVFALKDLPIPATVEDKPDFYFAVYKQKREIFRSKVMAKLSLPDVERFVMREGEVIDLGTFLIDAH